MRFLTITDSISVRLDWANITGETLKAGTPVTIEGLVSNSNAAIGLLANDVARGNGNAEVNVVISGVIDINEVQASYGNDLTDECVAALQNITFVNNGKPIYPTELPDTSSAITGDVLKLGENGLEWDALGSGELPPVSASDNGKVVAVVDGDWRASNILAERIKPANRFNLNTATANASVNSSTGEIGANTTRRVASDYISVTGHKTITFSARVFSYAYYNAEKTFVSGGTMSAAGTLTIPDNVTYIRVTVGAANINDFTATFDGETTTEKRYGCYSEAGFVKANVNKEVAENNVRNDYDKPENILENATIVSINSGCAYWDDVHHGKAEKGLKIACTNGVTEGRVYLSTPSAVSMNGVYDFEIHAYVTGASNISSITFYGTQSAESISGGISISVPVSNLVNGWNTLHAYTYKASSLINWSNFQYFTFRMAATGDCSVTIAEINPKRSGAGKIIVVDDHGFNEFLTSAYPSLKALGIPTTWAVQWGELGEETTWGTHLTEAQIETLVDDPFSEFSFHSWDGSSTASTTDAENRADMQKCITALKKHNAMPLHLWRAAWVQNEAANVGGIYDMLEGSAYYSGESGTFLSIPFPDVYNIPRYALHSSTRDQAWFDNIFDYLKKTHCAVVLYTHSVVANDSEYSGNNITEAQLEMFLTGCATGVSEGWLKGTTFSWEMTRQAAKLFK